MTKIMAFQIKQLAREGIQEQRMKCLRVNLFNKSVDESDIYEYTRLLELDKILDKNDDSWMWNISILHYAFDSVDAIERLWIPVDEELRNEIENLISNIKE